jgi:hypothetical protein
VWLAVPLPPVVNEVVARRTGAPSRSAGIGIWAPIADPPISLNRVEQEPTNAFDWGPTTSGNLAYLAIESIGVMIIANAVVA